MWNKNNTEVAMLAMQLCLKQSIKTLAYKEVSNGDGMIQAPRILMHNVKCITIPHVSLLNSIRSLSTLYDH